MKSQDDQEPDNRQSMSEDLTVNEAQAEEVKGGTPNGKQLIVSIKDGPAA